jgi:hypothetical protein
MINLTNNGADGARWTVDVYGIMHGRHVDKGIIGLQQIQAP